MQRIRSLTRLKTLAIGALIAAVAAAVAVPVGAAPKASADGTLVDKLVARSGSGGFDTNGTDFDLLIEAVTTAGLAGALSDPSASLTVLAPNDAAFVATARTLGYSGSGEAGAWTFLVGALTTIGGGDPIPVLQSILKYHVVPDRMSIQRISRTTSLPTLEGPRIGVRFVQFVDRDPDLPDPRLNVFVYNVGATNGVIHGLTRVLIPTNL
jgi:uncharacterized surface protein with fasciclin (FAS1) repeats